MKFLIAWIALVTIQVLYLGEFALERVRTFFEKYLSGDLLIFMMYMLFAALYFIVSLAAFAEQKNKVGIFFILSAAATVTISLFRFAV